MRLALSATQTNSIPELSCHRPARSRQRDQAARRKVVPVLAQPSPASREHRLPRARCAARLPLPLIAGGWLTGSLPAEATSPIVRSAAEPPSSRRAEPIAASRRLPVILPAKYEAAGGRGRAAA